MVNKGDIYAFQPVEINDENITVFERKIPIDFKRNKITMEIPKEFSQNDDVNTDEIDYETIMREIKQNVEIATEEHMVTQGDQNWYKHASLVSNHLLVIHEIPFTKFVDYIIYHNITFIIFI